MVVPIGLLRAQALSTSWSLSGSASGVVTSILYTHPDGSQLASLYYSLLRVEAGVPHARGTSDAEL